MIKNITIGQYIPGNSIIHRLDPRFKILASLIMLFSLFFVKSFYGYLVILIFILLIVSISKISIKTILRGIKPILILLIFTGVLNMFYGEGEVIFQVWFLKVYQDGIIRAAFLISRLILLILSTSILTLTTSPISLTDGIEKLLNPFKKIGVPAHELAMMMTISLRFIPTLMDETDKIMKAQMSRGVDFSKGSIIERAKNLIPILIPLFINSFKRAEELAMAMESRCYRGGEGRTRMRILKITYRECVCSIILILFITMSILPGRFILL